MACDETTQINITKGEDGRVIDLYLTAKKTGRPYDLTGATEITVKFPGTTATLVKLLTGGGVSVIGNAVLGHIQVTLSAANINGLSEGNGKDILVWVTKASSLKKTTLKGLLYVLKDPFT